MDRKTVKYWRFLNSAGINPNTVWEEVEDEGGRYLRTPRGKDEWATFVPDSMHLDRPQHKANWATACNVEGNALVLAKPSNPLKEGPVPAPTGGSNDYYKVRVDNPTTGVSSYTAECNDIIEALGMNFAEGNVLKALWRSCAARTLGKKKPNGDSLYDAEKMVFFSERIVEQRKYHATAN